MDIVKSILHIIPDFKFGVWDNDYNGVKRHELETRPIPTLAELEAAWDTIKVAVAREAKQEEIREKGAALMLQITAPYSPEERDTWATQVTEAHAYPNGDTSMLTALCAQRGNTVADQVSRILANEAAFKVAVGAILGIQQSKLDAIQAATTVEAVNAITWEA